MSPKRKPRAPSAEPATIAESVAPARLYERQARDVLAELERDRPADDEEWCISTGALRALIAQVRG